MLEMMRGGESEKRKDEVVWYCNAVRRERRGPKTPAPIDILGNAFAEKRRKAQKRSFIKMVCLQLHANGKPFVR